MHECGPTFRESTMSSPAPNALASDAPTRPCIAAPAAVTCAMNSYHIISYQIISYHIISHAASERHSAGVIDSDAARHRVRVVQQFNTSGHTHQASCQRAERKKPNAADAPWERPPTTRRRRSSELHTCARDSLS